MKVRVFFSSIFFLIILFSFTNKQKMYQIIEKPKIMSDIKKFSEKAKKNDILRTYEIQFTFFEKHLDTSSQKTIIFLDSLATMIIKKNLTIEVGIHFSLRYSKSEARNYNFMYEEIINYLNMKGVPNSNVVGKVYYDNYPIFTPDKTKVGKELEQDYIREQEINNRVEIKLLKRG